MNVSCTSCSAKYAIPDEKVRGKKVKITCKHCGTGIIVDGTKIDAAAPPTAATVAPAATVAAPAPAVAAPIPVVSAPAAAAPTPIAPAPAAPTPVAPAPAVPAELTFDIAYPDDRQETLTVSQIVDKYASGALTDEAFIWREGMADWKAPFEVPELQSAFAARGLKPKSAAKAPSPFVSPFAEDNDATVIQSSPFDNLPADVAGEWREPAKEAPSNPEAAFDLRPSSTPLETPEPAVSPKQAAASPQPAAASPKPAAVSPQPAAVSPKPGAMSPQPSAASPKPAASAQPSAPALVAKQEASKPSAARRSAARGGADLFGDLAAAGSEDDESLGTDAKEAAPKLTGARNESSVLFSLDALVKQEQKPAPKKSSAEKQEDTAALLMGMDSGPGSIANVGNSFGSAFAAPDFTAPVLAPAPDTRAAAAAVEIPLGPGAKKKGAGVWLALVAVLVLGGGAAATVLSGKLANTPAPTPSPTPSTPAASKPEPSPEAAPAPPAESAAGSIAQPSGGAGSVVAATTAGAAATAGAATPAGGATAAGTPPVAAVTPKPTEALKPTEKPADKPADKPAEKPAEPASSAPFDTAAAKAALGSAAANAGSCKTADGPTGSGKVSVTFMPSGRATNTQVSGDLAGTAVGGCVARLFRSAKVPAFSGDAVTVTKSFTVQ